MSDYFKCQRCGNDDINKIGMRNGKPYCRACISFSSSKAEVKVRPSFSSLKLDYELSEEQNKVSNKVLTNYKNGINTIIDAVTGAGKTELVFATISYALTSGHKIGFVSPRREVTMEIASRFKKAFPKNSIISVYGGHSYILDAEIICLTSHQLYRYINFFDLIIFDEVDAFPYKGNEVLESLFLRSIKGNHVLMSATPSMELLQVYKKKGFDIVKLNVRYHGSPLPVPKVKILLPLFNILYLIYVAKKLIKKRKKLFIFLPTINDVEMLYQMIKMFIKKGNFVHSRKKDKEEVIKSFREGKYDYLVTSTLLERGVTYEHLQVIVFKAEHSVFSQETLIQISGRVGRKKISPDGEVIFIGGKATKEMQNCIRIIEEKNKDLQDLF
ncbi:MAG: DEAD/DEAH box helicase family protein [Erysipelotrichaceae bacterium]|jgi:competence protein ComFA|nr:DEAD/DEAH box helicase family protein [Erysipelotrichaceae bacterium]